MIYYFSGTGNSQWAAETLAKALHEELCCIPDVMLQVHKRLNDLTTKRLNNQTTKQPNDRIFGLVFPVNGWMPPKIVREFISRLDCTRTEYCFCLVTAGDSIGETVRVLRKDLAKVSIQLDAAFTLIMPESYVCLPGFYTDKPEKERRKIAKATADLTGFINDIQHRRHVERTVKGFLPFVLTYILGVPFNRFFITDKPFRVNPSRCTRCGMCAKVCPVHNISMQDTPVWKKDGTCTNCMACYHHCPVHAINYWTTKKKGQYYFGKNNDENRI